MNLLVHQHQSQTVKIWVDLMFRDCLDSTETQALQHFADEVADFPDTQVWIFAPDFIKIGGIPENLFISEVTDEVTEKGRWLLIKRPKISKHLYDWHYIVVVVCPAENASMISDAIQKFWRSHSRKYGKRVFVRMRKS